MSKLWQRWVETEMRDDMDVTKAGCEGRRLTSHAYPSACRMVGSERGTFVRAGKKAERSSVMEKRVELVLKIPPHQDPDWLPPVLHLDRRLTKAMLVICELAHAGHSEAGSDNRKQ
jgi:hypothetical protein